jgi:RNA-binding protein YhbY
MEEKLLARVRALLAKAEATDYPDEAEAFTAKAAELIAKYGIDEAMLAAAGGRADEIKQVKINISDAYSTEKAILLGGIANALRCRCVTYAYKGSRTVLYAHVLGYGVDLERVELLYTSLLFQASSQVTEVRPSWYDDSSVRTYRKSWLMGFATAVQNRLTAAENKAAEQAQRAATVSATGTGAPSTDLVLLDRVEKVDAEYDRLHPNLEDRKYRARLTSEGYSGGHAAGRRADLGNTRLGGTRTALK